MKWHVYEVMTQGVYCTTPDTTLEVLVKELKEKAISAAPVVNDKGSLTGFVSLKDLALARPEQHVREFVRSPVYTIDQAATMPMVINAFRKHKVHHLVVVHQDQVLGIVSLVDMLGPMLENYGNPNFMS